MPSSLVTLVKINVSNTGPGALTLGSAAEGYRGREVLANGVTYSYSIQQGSAWEFGRGTYLADTGQIVRSVIDSSDGGAAISLKPNAQISLTAIAEDLMPMVQVTEELQGNREAAELARDQSVAAKDIAVAKAGEASGSAAAAAGSAEEAANQVPLVQAAGAEQIAAVTTAGGALTAAAPVTLVLGRPTAASLSAPTTAISTQEWVYGTAATVDCIIGRIWLNAFAAGSIRIEAFTRSGDDWTPVPGSWCCVEVAAGAQIIDLLGQFKLLAGQYIGVRGSGVLGVTAGAGTADSGGFFVSATNYQGAPFNDAAADTGFRMQFGIELISLRTLANGGSALATLIDKALRGQTFQIGRIKAMTTSGTLNSIVQQIVFGEAAPRRGIAKRFLCHAGVAGTLSIRTYTRSGNVFTATGRELLVPVTAGINTVTLNDMLVIEPGHYWGVAVQKTGTVTVVSADQDGRLIGFYTDGAAGTASFTDATIDYSFSVQARLEFEAIDDSTPERGIAQTLIPLSEYANPKGHILVWVLGQSNAFGFANTDNVLTFASGRGYKFNHTGGTIDAMADPTGAPGRGSATPRGSFGPAICDAVLRASGGQVGALVVNSGYPNTNIGTNWASAGVAWTAAVSDITTALSAAATAGIDIVGCCAVWCQGETDGDSSTTAAAYKTAFADLLTRIRSQIGSKTPVLMVRTGYKSTGDTAGYQAIRGAQDDIVEDTAGVFMAHTRAFDFNNAGLQFDTYHYTAAGYDEIGRALGQMSMRHGFGLRPTGYGN